MAYEKQTWINRDATKPANATRLNHIEDGIYNAYNVSLTAITNIQPSECNEGDKYYNTTDNLIYTATGSNEWSETGETPIGDKTYVLIEDGSTYMYNGTTLTRIGGSEQEVENEYSESETLPYSCDYSNNNFSKKYINAKETSRWVQSFSSWVLTPLKISSGITNDSEMFDLDITNKRIIIGANVSKIKLTAQVAWTNANASGEFDIQITKNGNSAYMLYNSAIANSIQNLTVAPININVQEGDYIQLCMFGGISSAEILSTNLFIEKME